MFYRFKKRLEHLTGGATAKIIAAVSGGADSVAMLHLLSKVLPKENLVVAHMNFNLRGEESDTDQLFVENFAGQLGLKLFVKSVDTTLYAKEHSVSIEMAARELRYSWFEQLLSTLKFDYVAVAHNANDNAETLLLNLTRGTGLKGLCGMSECDGRHILRPLLTFTREQIEQYLAGNGLTFRLDSTNAENNFYRNRIRNNVFEQLRQINPSVIATFNENIVRLRQAYALIDERVGQILSKVELTAEHYLGLRAGAKGAAINSALSGAYLKKVIDLEALLKFGEDGYNYTLFMVLSQFGFNSAQAADIALKEGAAGIVKIENSAFVAIKERGYLKIYDSAITKSIEAVEVCLPPAGEEVTVEFGPVKFLFASLQKGMQPLKPENNSLTICTDSLPGSLLLRTPLSGERFTPFGMRGSKKLGDYFTDLKIDNGVKHIIPLLAQKENPGNIIALPGLEISDSYKVTSSSERLLKIELINS